MISNKCHSGSSNPCLAENSPDVGKNFHIQEMLRAFHPSQLNAVLYAYVEDQITGALDFSRTNEKIQINTIYVRPDFRARGIGTALAKFLLLRYPNEKVLFAKAPNLPKALCNILDAN